ncbi:hypothetical protein B296_00054137, partial [Ensete ventricosum]
MDTAHTGRYILVRPLAEMRTACYRAVPLIGAVSVPLSPEIGRRRGRRTWSQRCSPDPFACVIRRPRDLEERGD